MPIYSLGCPKCEHRCERQCKIAERHNQVCPKCGAKMEVIIDKINFQLVGGGWGKDGYGFTDKGGKT